MHHAFLYISLPSLYDYDVKWPNFKFFWGRERQAHKFYHFCLNLDAVPSLHLQPKFPFLSNWATWDNREKKWKDAKAIFQGRFHGRPRCRIVRSLLVNLRNRTGEERRQQTLCDKRDKKFVGNNSSPTLGARDFSSAVSGFCQPQHLNFPPHARKTSGTQGTFRQTSFSFKQIYL